MSANHFSTNRRLFLAASLAIATSSAVIPCSAAIVAADSASVTADRHDLMRVRIEIAVKGNVNVSENSLASKQTHNTFPITSQATLDYEERALSPAGAAADSEIVAAERHYHSATNSSVLNKTTLEQELRPAMRHAIVRRESLPETVYSPDNYFTHGELSLLKSPVSSVSVDLLLPGDNVIQGDRYQVNHHALCSVLNLTSVDAGTVEGSVVEINAESVRFELNGDIEGSVDGVGTRIRLVGKMNFDRQAKTCTWLALAVHETREISRAEPGFDISATIRMVRRPLPAAVALPLEPATVDFDAKIPAERMYVELQSQQLLVGTMMDRRWRMIDDVPGSSVLRMIDNDVSIAQCNLRQLVRLPESKQLTIQGFESEVRQSLGDKLGQLIEGDQLESAQGLQVLRLVADGETQGVPIRWIMMHFADQTGRRVQATFTMSGDKIETFAGNDVQFADSLRFLDPADLHDGKPATEQPIAAPAADGLDVANRPTPIDAEATSSSDLK